jgi:Endosomal/lysosomal potassium channel TMEM175
MPVETQTRRERTESARLDNFVDGAFAFAITLLVISGASLPRDVTALEHALRDIPAFAACFLQLVIFWHGHVRWRDAVRLADATSLRLSLILVFFALIFVFPLHLVYAGLFHGISGGALSPDVAAGASPLRAMSGLFVCYGLSYACMAGTLWALFRHGTGPASNLPPGERISARVHGLAWACAATVGLLSTLIALAALPTGNMWLIPAAGFSYLLLGFTGVAARRYRGRLEAALPP